MIPLLDFEAPIEPRRGLAGLELGRHVSDYRELLFQAQSNYFLEDESEDDWRSTFTGWSSLFGPSRTDIGILATLEGEPDQ